MHCADFSRITPECLLYCCNYSTHECCMNKGGCWAWWSKALWVQDLRLSANPLKKEIIKCCYRSYWPTQDMLVCFYLLNVYLARPPDMHGFSGLLVFPPNGWWMALICILEITMLIWDKLPGKVKSDSDFFFFSSSLTPLSLSHHFSLMLDSRLQCNFPVT